MSGKESDDIVIAGIGMATPVGLTAKDTYYSVRAGVSRFRESAFKDLSNQNIVMASIPDECLAWNVLEKACTYSVDGVDRLACLYRLACQDLMDNLSTDIKQQSYPLFLGASDRIFDRQKIIKFCQSTDLINLSDQPVRIFSEGRASSLIALHESINAIKNGEIQGAYVAGCDTHANLRTLISLDSSKRLKSEKNSDGFIPGEGSGVLLVVKEADAIKYNCTIYARLVGSSRGFEEGHLESDEPYKGEGLAKCADDLFQNVQTEGKVDRIYSSMNGEDYWAKEWGVTHLRSKEKFSVDYKLHHPADCIGDTGAALGVLMVGLAAYEQNLKKLCAEVFLYASSDTGQRCSSLIC